jgi:hypothetical protein
MIELLPAAWAESSRGYFSERIADMKRLTTLLTLLALAFYVAWPAYAGLTIKGALEAKDTALLASKVDFPAVRESMRPAVTGKVESLLANALKTGAGVSGPLADQFKAQLAPKVVEAALTALVKPETLIRIHAEGGRIKDVLERIIKEEAAMAGAGGGPGGALGGGAADATGAGTAGGSILGKLGKAAEQLGIDPGKALGGLLGIPDQGAAEPLPAKSGPAPKYSLANIKHAGLNGPLGISIGLAKDAAAKDADVTVEMSFTGNDWKTKK